MEDNCLNCLYSEETDFTQLMNKVSHHENMICKHDNSPYYNKVVDELTSCRLYVNSIEFFKLKDRKNNIKEIMNKIKKKR